MAEISNDLANSKPAILALFLTYFACSLTFVIQLWNLWKAIFSKECKSQAFYCISLCCFAISYVTLFIVFFCQDFTLLNGVILVTASICFNLGLLALQISIVVNINVCACSPIGLFGAGVLQVVVQHSDVIVIDSLNFSFAVILAFFGVFVFGMLIFWSPVSRRSIFLSFLSYVALIPVFVLLKFAPPTFPPEAIPLIFCFFVSGIWCLTVTAILSYRRWSCSLCMILYLFYVFFLILWRQSFSKYTFTATWLLCTLIVVTTLSVILRTCKDAVSKFSHILDCLSADLESQRLKDVVDGILKNSGNNGPDYDDAEPSTLVLMSPQSPTNSPPSDDGQFFGSSHEPTGLLASLEFDDGAGDPEFPPNPGYVQQAGWSSNGCGHTLNQPTESDFNSGNHVGGNSQFGSSHLPVEETNRNSSSGTETDV